MNRKGPALAKVLLVEDNEADIVLTREILRRENVRLDLDAVYDGDEALDYLRGRGPYRGMARPHLILLDRNLPRLDGDAVIREIRADPELASIPVAVLSGSDAGQRVEADAYIVKPVHYENLAAAVENLPGVRFETHGQNRCLCIEER